MVRQSLKADPLGDATTYLREMTAAAEEEYRRLEEESNQKREEWEALRNRLAELYAGYDRLQAALGTLEGHPTAGNGQDTHVVSEPSTPHLVAIDPPPRAFVGEATLDALEALPLTDPVEEPPPEAA